ncbi:MAPEG family protein [Luteimonas sp. MJ246]|uniref:MAPEG family protein n=1 Tax=Luteimonas sp. MJ174 TaxID=3129237 RepID=UPI0031BB3F68
MTSNLILWPAVVLVALTFVVAVVMYRRRVSVMKRERVHPQSVALSAQIAQRLTDTRASDNYRNLFELPVLFYFAVAVAMAARVQDPWVLGLAWAFVGLRIVHSVIQCGSNKVMHRFQVFIAGFFVLALLWIRLAWYLFLV